MLVSLHYDRSVLAKVVNLKGVCYGRGRFVTVANFIVRAERGFKSGLQALIQLLFDSAAVHMTVPQIYVFMMATNFIKERSFFHIKRMYSRRLVVVGAIGFWVSCGASHGFDWCSIYWLQSLYRFLKQIQISAHYV